MAAPTDVSVRPKGSRHASHVPGGFDDTDDDFPPLDVDNSQGSSKADQAKITTVDQDNSIITASSETGGIALPEEDSTLEEKEIRQRLMDEDSTPVTVTEAGQQDGQSPETNIQRQPSQQSVLQAPGEEHTPASPDTPPGMYQTPAPGREESPPESMSSSPTAQAAARRPLRLTSTMSPDGYKTASDGRNSIPQGEAATTEDEETPHKPRSRQSSVSQGTETPTPKQAAADDLDGGVVGDTDSPDFNSMRSRKRPKFFNSRVATQTSSYSTYTTTSTQGDSDVTVGADYALQTGGAAPFASSLSSRPRMDYSRTISLGSMASGVSGLSEDTRTDNRDESDEGMQTLSEGGPSTMKGEDSWTPATPRVVSNSTEIPTDTVLAQRIKDIEVPATAAREYRNRHRPPSPNKRLGASTASNNRNGRNLTLKEQSGTIDRLTKENWDLKMKITFLDDSLNKRSPEGTASLINENAGLKAFKLTATQEVRDLKRSIRNLERALKSKEGELDEVLRNARKETDTGSTRQDTNALESELRFLRNRVISYDVEIERAQHETFEQKRETDKLVKLLDYRQSHGADAAVQEEVNMWKEQIDIEVARREQADEENQRLKDRIWQLEHGHRMSNGYNRNEDSERAPDDTGASEVSSRTIYEIVEQLQHDNNGLRREVAAQMSMLTSRNREKQLLDQEIEELKLAARRDSARSVAGDSTLDRPVPRFHGRPTSRASNTTRVTQMSDAERDTYENKNAELRDINAALKIEIQDVTKELDRCVGELEQMDTSQLDYQKLQQKYDRDIAMATQDLQDLQAERDEALGLQEVLEDQYEKFERKAQDEYEQLESMAGEKITSLTQELDELDLELKSRDDALNDLSNQMRHTSDNLAHLEEVMKEKDREIEELAEENQTAHNDYLKLQTEHRELVTKSDLAHVQNESHHKEIAFLREEQDGDKIKIGNLQAELTSLRDRAKELENRLAQEKHQREVIDSREKREVQKVVDELNREISEGKAECRDVKQNLQSREVELTTFKERLLELESNLKEVLGAPDGTRSSLLTSITKLQKELESRATELDLTKDTLSQKENLLRNRDALLESHGLESKKLSDLLDRERQSRRADKAQHEQWQKSHQHTTRTVTQKDQRITELEHDRQAIRKKVITLETNHKDQLQERNQLLLNLWTRLAPMCGSDWQHQNNLVNNHVPTLEVVSSQLPGFSKNLLAATKTIEGLMMGFKGRIRAVERDLWKEYQELERSLDDRVKRIDKLEATVQSNRVSGTFSAAPEIAKLRGENRLLKSEIAALQKQESQSRARSGHSSTKVGSTNGGNNLGAPPPSLSRSYTSSHIETLERAGPNRTSSSSTIATLGNLVPSTQLTSQPIEPSQQRWIHRLKELERRLKAEREARLLDRTAARKRLEEGMEVNEMLKSELERERGRKGR